MNKIISIIMLFTSVCIVLVGCVASVNTTDLNPGMTQQEVILKLGKPVRALLSNGERFLVYKINDTLKRSDNIIAIGFIDDKLVSILPLSEAMQEMGPIDRALRSRIPQIDNGSSSNNGGSYIQTPNAYGPGIHMDQYGRPVQVVPR